MKKGTFQFFEAAAFPLRQLIKGQFCGTSRLGPLAKLARQGGLIPN